MTVAARPVPWTAPPRFAALHIVAVITGGLALDRWLGWTGQHLATLWTLAVWVWLYRAGGPLERRVLVWCTLISGAGEVFLSLVWGLYDYQFHNVPAFVPPGHALLMTLGLLVSRRLPAASVWAVALAGAAFGAWAWVSGADRFGVALFVVFLACTARGRDRRLFAAMFVLALVMELYGTALGNWTWMPVAPWTGLSQANPPYAAGALYCLLDFLVLAALRRWPAPGPAPAAAE